MVDQMPRTVIQERVVATLLLIVGLYPFLLSLRDLEITNLQFGQILLALSFTSAIVLADHFPIHLLRGAKLSLINLPIFLSAALLSAPLAILATGSGLFIAQMLARDR